MSLQVPEGMKEPTKVEGGREAAAQAITGGILGEAMATGYAVNEKTLEAAQEAQEPPQEAPAEAPPDPVEQIVDSLTQEAEQQEEVPLVEAEDDELEVPDFEAEAEKELLDEEISAASEEGYETEEWGIDPEVNEARKRALVAEKKAAYYEKITATRERKKWEAEADKHYPMWRARGEITATSKRGFLKAAKEANDAVKPFVAEATRKVKEQLEEERATVKAEEKQKAQEAWGKPTVAANITPAGQRDFEAEYKDARKNQDLARMLSVKREWREATGGEPDE